jgi:thioredoxin 2
MDFTLRERLMAGVTACPSCGKQNRVPVAATGTPVCAACKARLPWLVDAGTDAFDGAVQAAVPVLVDLWAPWCGPCRAVAPVLEQLAQDRAGELKVVKVNVDLAPEVSARLGVQGIPTMLLYIGGREVDRQVGALPRHELDRWLEPHVGRTA